MSTDLSSRFTLFSAKEKKQEKSPDVNGSLEIADEDVSAWIQYLQQAERVTNYQGNPVVKVRLSAWISTSQSGTTYLGGKASPDNAPQSAPAPAANPIGSMFG